MECTNDVEKLRKRFAKDRIYIFHVGLDHYLDQVSSQILATPLLYQSRGSLFTSSS